MTDDLVSPGGQTEKDYVADLVGEGKKFRDLQDLAKGKLESDDYIKTLTEKLDELREDNKKFRDEINAGRTMQEMLDQLQQTHSTQPPVTTPGSQEPPKTPAFDPKTVADLVASEFQNQELAKRQTENRNMVLGKLREHFGDTYEAALKQKMDELDLSPEMVNTLAKTNPKALIRTLGVDGPKQNNNFQAPPRSTTNFLPNAPAKRTWSYYQDLRKKDPDLYYSPKVTAQRHADHRTLGDAFEDGDWQN